MATELAWGDVRMADLGGRAGSRPVLVMTRTRFIGYLNAVTVAPITRTIRGAPTEILVGEREGLRASSAANLDALQTIAKDRLGRWLGSVSAERRAEIRRALLFALELDDED